MRAALPVPLCAFLWLCPASPAALNEAALKRGQGGLPWEVVGVVVVVVVVVVVPGLLAALASAPAVDAFLLSAPAAVPLPSARCPSLSSSLYARARLT